MTSADTSPPDTPPSARRRPLAAGGDRGHPRRVARAARAGRRARRLGGGGGAAAAAGGHPARRAGCCCRRPSSPPRSRAAAASTRSLARDPARDLAIGPAPGRIHVHNMGEAPAVGDPRTRPRPAGRPSATRRSATRVMHHQRLPRLHQQPRDAGRRAGRAAPAVLVPRHRRRDRQAHRRPRPGPRLADAGALRDGSGRAVGPARRDVPAGGIVLDMGYSPVSPLHLGAGRLRRHHRGGAARDGRAGAHQPGGRHDGAGVAGRRARPAGRRDPRRCGAGAGGRARRRLRLRGAALGGRPARRPASLRRRPVGARLRRRHAPRAPPRPGLRLLRPRHVGAARRRAGRLPAGAARRSPARSRARASMSGIGAWGDTSTCLELLVVGDAVYRQALDSLEPPAWDDDALDVDAHDRGRHRPRWASSARGTRAAGCAATAPPRTSAGAVGPRNGSPPAVRTRSSWRASASRQALAQRARRPAGRRGGRALPPRRRGGGPARPLRSPGPAPPARRGAGLERSRSRSPARGAPHGVRRRGRLAASSAAASSTPRARTLVRSSGNRAAPDQAGDGDDREGAASAQRVQRPAAEQRAEGVPGHVHERPHAHVAAAQRHRREPRDHGRRDRDEQHDAEADEDDAEQGARARAGTAPTRRRRPAPGRTASSAACGRACRGCGSRGTAGPPWRRRRRSSRCSTASA